MIRIAQKVPLLGFCSAGSGAGKTTLLASLIPVLTQHGLRISAIKHAHHAFDIDYPGKDSYRLREAGAVQTLLGSRHRWALMTELARTDNTEQPEPTLAQLLAHIDTSLADLVVVEGFKSAFIPKIEVYRAALNMPLLADDDANIIAIASDAPVASTLPVLDLNNAPVIAQFIMQWLKKPPDDVKFASSFYELPAA